MAKETIESKFLTEAIQGLMLKVLVESMALPHPVEPEQHHPCVHPLHGARLSQGWVWVRLLVESQLTCIEGSQFSGKEISRKEIDKSKNPHLREPKNL